MRILIITNFPNRLDGGSAKGRFLYLGEMLCERGHEVELICSDFDHSKKQHRAEGSIKQEAYKTKITTLHESGYPNNVSLKRLWSHFVWGINVEKYLKKQKKPDVIYCAVPSLTAGVRAARYCKKNSVRFVIDVQDLWPEAFQMAIKNKYLQKVFLPIKWYVDRIYCAADKIVAVSETYVERVLAVNNKGDKGLCVFLGNDGKLFDDSRGQFRLPEIDSLRLAYIGNLSYSYDIPCVINALKKYNKLKRTPSIKLLVMGDGDLRKEFEKEANISNIDYEFTGSLPYPQMVSYLCCCDMVVNPIVSGSVASIINKVGDYALSGLPVINTQGSKEYRKLIEDYNSGINCKTGDADDVENALEILAKDIQLRKRMGKNARKLGVERFDRRVTYKKLVEAVEK